MGKVAITFKIMPTSVEIDLDKILEAIKEKLEIQDSKKEPIAFGINSLTVLILTEDRGGTDEYEEIIKSIEGVESVEVESVTLL